MGGCYSAASNEANKSPRHKLPRENPGRRKKYNGVSGNGSETEVYEVKSSPPESELLLENKSVGTNCENEEEKKVVPSDSGIESLAPNSLKDDSETPNIANEEPLIEAESNLESESKSWYNQTSDCETCKDSPVDPPDIAKDFALAQNYCSCGPRHAGKPSWQNNSVTRCQTHMNSPKFSRNSDLTGLKSSFRDFMRKADKKVRLSWKSSDSLDINKQMTTHLDRTKSEASEIFKDDISFCAPLAQFDSVGCSLDRQNSNNRISTVSTASEIESVARDICNCDFYANNLASELDSLVPERHEIFPSDANKANSPEVNGDINHVQSDSINVVKSDQNEISSHLISEKAEMSTLSDFSELIEKKKISEKHITKQVSLASLSSNVRPSLSSLADVTMTTYEGRDMVMIETDTYTQILDELSLLKSQLSQLTAVIQDDLHVQLNQGLKNTLDFDDSLTLQDTLGSETDLS